MTSPWVQRNLDNAQYAQPRGSQYEGPDLGQDVDEFIFTAQLLPPRWLLPGYTRHTHPEDKHPVGNSPWCPDGADCTR